MTIHEKDFELFISVGLVWFAFNGNLYNSGTKGFPLISTDLIFICSPIVRFGNGTLTA